MPSTLSLIRNMFHDPPQRTRAIAVWTSSFTVGGMLGPLLGGLMLEYFWWGSVFLLSVPAMVLLLALGSAAAAGVPRSRRRAVRLRQRGDVARRGAGGDLRHQAHRRGRTRHGLAAAVHHLPAWSSASSSCAGSADWPIR